MYVFTFSKIINFKQHLNDVRQWDDVRASSARINFGYCKKRELPSPTKRKTKPRNMKDDSAPSQIFWKTRYAYATI